MIARIGFLLILSIGLFAQLPPSGGGAGSGGSSGGGGGSVPVGGSYISLSEKGAAGGVATLDGASKVPIGQIPTGATNNTVSPGNHDHIGVYEIANPNIQPHIANTSNPHGVDKTQVGLGNVPNTDATLRANHTGTQTASTIVDLASAIAAMNAGTASALLPSAFTGLTADAAPDVTDYLMFLDASTGVIKKVLISNLPTSGGGTAGVSSLAGTANQIAASSSTGGVTLSIPTNPTLPGTTTGTFVGNLTGNVTGNVTGSATAITSAAITGLAADGSPDSAADYVVTFDASASALKKVLLSNLPVTSTSGVTSLSGTTNQVSVSSSSGSVTVSIPNNPTLPGTTTGTFSGNLTGNVTGSATAITSAAITALTADASPDSAADYVVTYDASATALKKVLIANLPSSGGGGTFLASGTGAVSRTSQDKARDIVSAKDFGAVGDGSTNDASAIAAAISAASSVMLPCGTYRVNSALTLNGKTLRAEAKGCAILQRGASGFDILTLTGTEPKLIDVVVDGNKATYTGYNIAVGNATSPLISGVTSKNATGTGLSANNSDYGTIENSRFVANNGGGIFGENNARYWKVHKNFADSGSGGHGIAFHSTVSGHTVDGASIEGNEIRLNGGSSYFCVEVGSFGGLEPKGVVVLGNRCIATANSSFGGYSIDTCTDSIVKGNYYDVVTYSSTLGIEIIASDRIVVEGNVINGGTTLQTGIAIDRDSSNNRVIGNVINGFDSTGAGTGIKLLASDAVTRANRYNTVEANTVVFASSGLGIGISLRSNQGTSTVSYNNIVNNVITGGTGSGSYGIQLLNDAGTTDSNILQGNVVRSVTNGIYQGAGVSNSILTMNKVDVTTVTNAYTNNVATDAAKGPLFYNEGNGFASTGAVYGATGTTIASAAALPLGNGNSFHVSGTTTITSVTPCNAANSGRTVILIFNGVLTVTDGSNLKLAGNFVTTADDVLHLVCDGTSWFEVSRAAN